MLLRRHLRVRLWSRRWDQTFGSALVERAETEAGKDGVVWSRFLDDACCLTGAGGAAASAAWRCADRLAALASDEQAAAAARLLRFRYPPVLTLAGQGISTGFQEKALHHLGRPGLALGLARNPVLTPTALAALGRWLGEAMASLAAGDARRWPGPCSVPAWADVEVWLEVAERLAGEGWPRLDCPVPPAMPAPRRTRTPILTHDAVRSLALPAVSFALTGGSRPAAWALEEAVSGWGRALPPDAVFGLARRRWPGIGTWLSLLKEAPSPALFQGLAHAWPPDPPGELRRILRAFFEDAVGLSAAAYPHNLVSLRNAVVRRPELSPHLREVALEAMLAGVSHDVLWLVYLQSVDSPDDLVAALPAILTRPDLIQEAVTHASGGKAVVGALLRLPGGEVAAERMLKELGTVRRDPAVRAEVLDWGPAAAKLLLLKDRRPAEYPVLVPVAAQHDPVLALEVLESATAEDLAGIPPAALTPLFAADDQRVRERAMRCLGKIGRSDELGPAARRRG